MATRGNPVAFENANAIEPKMNKIAKIYKICEKSSIRLETTQFYMQFHSESGLLSYAPVFMNLYVREVGFMWHLANKNSCGV